MPIPRFVQPKEFNVCGTVQRVWSRPIRVHGQHLEHQHGYLVVLLGIGFVWRGDVMDKSCVDANMASHRYMLFWTVPNRRV